MSPATSGRAAKILRVMMKYSLRVQLKRARNIPAHLPAWHLAKKIAR
jgi:hypothetical protein